MRRIATIKRMECFGGLIGIRATTIRKVEEALDAAGAVLSEIGVRMRPKRVKKKVG
jgi:hypothetical protein